MLSLSSSSRAPSSSAPTVCANIQTSLQINIYSWKNCRFVNESAAVVNQASALTCSVTAHLYGLISAKTDSKKANRRVRSVRKLTLTLTSKDFDLYRILAPRKKNIKIKKGKKWWRWWGFDNSGRSMVGYLVNWTWEELLKY